MSTYPTTPFERAVDRAIAAENARAATLPPLNLPTAEQCRVNLPRIGTAIRYYDHEDTLRTGVISSFGTTGWTVVPDHDIDPETEGFHGLNVVAVDYEDEVLPECRETRPNTAGWQQCWLPAGHDGDHKSQDRGEWS